MFIINFCKRLDPNSGPLVFEATTLPTEPQPLPIFVIHLVSLPVVLSAADLGAVIGPVFKKTVKGDDQICQRTCNHHLLVFKKFQ